MAGFVTKWTEAQTPTLDIAHEYWILYFDGSVMGPDAGAGVVRVSPERRRLRYTIRIHFSASNNIAEYEGMVNGLRIAIELGATRLYVYGDSKHMVDQTMKEANCEGPLMDAYCQEECKLKDKFRGIELDHLPQKDYYDANTLTKMAAQRELAPAGVFVNDLHSLSIHLKPAAPLNPPSQAPGCPATAD